MTYQLCNVIDNERVHRLPRYPFLELARHCHLKKGKNNRVFSRIKFDFQKFVMM
jgi:hypothetical protein